MGDKQALESSNVSITDKQPPTPTQDRIAGKVPVDVIELLKESSVLVKNSFFLWHIIPNVEEGTGTFVDTGKPDACVLATDNHVMRNVRATVQLHDGSEHPANVLARDLAIDVAYLKVEGINDPQKNCPVLPLAERHEEGGTARPVASFGWVRGEPKVFNGTTREFIPRYKWGAPRLVGEDMQRNRAAFRIGGGPGQSGAAIVNEHGHILARVQGCGNGNILGIRASDLRESIHRIFGN